MVEIASAKSLSPNIKETISPGEVKEVNEIQSKTMMSKADF